MQYLQKYPTTVVAKSERLVESEIKATFNKYEQNDQRLIWDTTNGVFVAGGFKFNDLPDGADIKNISVTINAQLVLSDKKIAVRAVKEATSISSSVDLGDGSISFIENASSRQTVTKDFPVAASVLTPEMLKNDVLQIRFYSNGGGYLYEMYITVAYELPKGTINVNVDPFEGGTVTGGGTYEVGTTATLTATSKTGYKFKQWSDGNTNATRTVTVTGNATYTAIFEKVATSNTFRGTGRQTVYRGTEKQSVYIGSKKIT